MRLMLRRSTLAACAALCLAATPSLAQTRAGVRAAPFVAPAWAFPVAAPAPAAGLDSVTRRHVPGSTAAFTDAQAADYFDVLDWHPEGHPPMPAIVAHGRKPAVFACGYCHLAEGLGRPENATLAGLPEAYILAQVADFRSGARASALAPYPPVANMRRVAEGATTAEVTAAARYFASLRPNQRSRVVEATRIPRAVAGSGLYFVDPRGGTEPLGERLIELGANRQAHELHDARASYVAYVPPGSIARGRALATAGRNGTLACTTCHGPGLRGIGSIVPPLAGRAPSYLLRQLLAFRTGTRSSAAGGPMRAEAGTLGLEDMIAVAAYAGSLKP